MERRLKLTAQDAFNPAFLDAILVLTTAEVHALVAVILATIYVQDALVAVPLALDAEAAREVAAVDAVPLAVELVIAVARMIVQHHAEQLLHK